MAEELPERRPPLQISLEEFSEADAFQISVYALRRSVLDVIKVHEDGVEHKGEVCRTERANVIALLMHSLQLSAADFPLVASILEFYDANHAHQHHG